MFPLKKHQSATPSVESNVPAKPVLSVESASLIDYAESLKERFGVSVFRQQLDTGLETQQLDNSEREAMMDRIKNTINDYDNRHPHTGPTHIYLLDGRGMGNADDGVVNALIASSLRNPSQTLAALIPENVTYTKPDDLSPSSMLRQLADQVLASEGVRCVIGRKALEAFLDGDEQYVHVGTTEGRGEAIFTGIVLAPFILAGIATFFHNRKIRKEEREFDNLIDQLKHSLKNAYLNAGWMAKHEFGTDPVSASDIASHVAVAGKIPASPAQAIEATIAKATTWLHAYVPAVERYLKVLTALAGKYGKDTSQYPKFLTELRALKHPMDEASFPNHQLLGDLVAESELAGRFAPGDWVILSNAKSAHAETLPSLSKEEVYKTAGALLKLFDLLTAIEKADAAIEGAFEKLPDIHAFANVEDDDEESDVSAEIENFYYRRNRDLEAALYGEGGLGAQLTKSIAAIGKWMDRSVVKSK